MAKSNKEIALEALKRAFIERDPTVVQLFASNYKQHNPVIPDGPSAIAKLIPTLAALTYEPGMAVAEGDLAMVHGRYTGWGPKPMVAVDIFRLKDGKVVGLDGRRPPKELSVAWRVPPGATHATPSSCHAKGWVLEGRHF